MKTSVLYGGLLAAAVLSGTATFSLAQTTADETPTMAEADDGFDLGWLGLLGLFGLAGLMRRDRPAIATPNRV